MRMYLFLMLFVFGTHPVEAQEVRLKDLINVRGDRTNSLVGFGLVIGLNQTGDSSKNRAMNKAFMSLMDRMGLPLEEAQIQTQSIAAVLVTADLPAFAQVGDKISIRLSTIGDAKSLAGGTLLTSPMKAGDGNIYAVASGAVAVGQATGKGIRSQNIAIIPNGGVIEKAFEPSIIKDGNIDISLKNPDFTTANRIADEINANFRDLIADPHDSSHIKIRVPSHYVENLTGFISELESLKIVPDDKAVVIINERTGTVVIGNEVKIKHVVVSHNGLSIQIGQGRDSKNNSTMNMKGSTVGELVDSLNQMGVKSSDLISILQSIYSSGALKGELRVI